MKMMNLSWSKSDPARQRSKAASTNAQRGLAIKGYAVAAWPPSAQLTLVKPVAVPKPAAFGSTVGVSASVRVAAAEENASNIVPEVPSEAGDMARLVAQESSAPVPEVLTAISDQAVLALPAEGTQIEPAATVLVVAPDAKAAEASIGGKAQSRVYVMADLVAEVKQLRLDIESAMAVFAQASRSRSASRRTAPPVDMALLQDLTGKRLLDIRAVEMLVGAKRSTIYGWIKKGKFVRQVRLSAKASRWVAGDVEAWLNDRTAARDQSATGDQTN